MAGETGADTLGEKVGATETGAWRKEAMIPKTPTEAIEDLIEESWDAGYDPESDPNFGLDDPDDFNGFPPLDPPY